MTSKTTTEWLAIFRAADIAAMPFHTFETLRGDPHLEAVGLVSLEEHPVEGTTAAIRSSISFDRSYPPMRAPSQARGSETRSILQEMGYPRQKSMRCFPPARRSSIGRMDEPTTTPQFLNPGAKGRRHFGATSRLAAHNNS